MSLQTAIDPSLPRVLERAPGLMWATDRELRITWMFGRLLQDLGLRSRQLSGKSLFDFLGTADDDQPGIAAHRRALSGEVVQCNLEYRGRRLKLRVEPDLDENDAPVGCIGVAEDITSLSRLEQQTLQTGHLQAAIGEILDVLSIRQPIAEQLDGCLDILLALPGLSRHPCGAILLAEPDRRTLVLRSQRNLPDSLRSAWARVPFGRCPCGRAVSAGECVHASCFESRHETRDERTREHAHYCMPIRAKGQLMGVLNLFLDPGHPRDPLEEQFVSIVSSVIANAIQYRQTAERLRQSEERFSLAVQAMDAGIWDWNLLTNQAYFSARWKELIGYADEEIGSRFAEWETRIHPEDRQRAIETIEHFLAGRSERLEVEHRLRHKDGSYRNILARGALVRDAAGQAYRMVGSHLDITSRKTLERDIREHHAQVLAAEEIQSSLLPKSAPAISGFEIAGKCFPADFAAGDHFDFLFLQNGSFLPVVGDVCGHGVGPAILMASVQAHLRSLAAVQPDLLEIHRQLNSMIVRESSYHRFVTLVAGEVDLNARLFSFVRCGHPPPMLLRRSGQLAALGDEGDLPLGIMPEADFHRVGPFPLQSGDVLLLFTDGILEAMSPTRGTFGRQGLTDALRSSRDKPASEIVTAVFQAAVDHSGGSKIDDDVTLLVVKSL